MKELLYKSVYREIFYHPDKNMIEMNYFDASSEYTDEEYKKEEIILRDFLEEKWATFCYVDTEHFDYIIVPEIQKFVAEVASTVLVDGKLKKLAVLTSQHVFTKVSVRQMGDKFSDDKRNICQIQHFVSKEVAIKWLFE